MSAQTKLEKELAAIDHSRAAVVEKLKEARGEKRIQCQHCGKSRPARKLIYIQTWWYTSPYGCTGGDYWNAGESRFICPECRKENRLIDLFKADWIVSYQPNFALTVNRHTYGLGSSIRTRTVDIDDAEAFKSMWTKLYGTKPPDPKADPSYP